MADLIDRDTHPTQTNTPNTLGTLDCVSRQEAIDALWKALFEYEDKTEKQFQESEELGVGDWFAHRIFVQNMSDIDRQTILNLPAAQPHWIPVSERLPEAECCPMDCLVTRKSKYIGNYTDMAVCEKNGTWTHEDWDAIVLGDVKDGKSTGLISTRDDNIIAWMPLPEPYKEGGNT